jgi:hypothetical protein
MGAKKPLYELSFPEKRIISHIVELVESNVENNIRKAEELANTLSTEAVNYLMENHESILWKFSLLEIRKKIDEMSSTGGGAAMTPGTGEQYATPKAFKKKKKDTKLETLLKEVSYNKFKSESKTRTKSESIHKAVKEVKKRVYEINKLMEYTNRMRNELSEGDGVRYSRHTENAINQITTMVAELYSNVKKFKK